MYYRYRVKQSSLTRYYSGNISCPFDKPRIGLTGFRDIVVLPVATCELEKIVARVDGRIHRLHYSRSFDKKKLIKNKTIIDT